MLAVVTVALKEYYSADAKAFQRALQKVVWMAGL